VFTGVGREPDRGDDDEEDHELRPSAQEVDARPHLAAGRALGQLLRPRADQQQRTDEDQVRQRVQPERRRDAEVLDGQRRARRADRAREVEGHRVQRDGGRHLALLDERGNHRLLGGSGERAHHPQRRGVGDHDRGRCEVEVREQTQPGRERDRDRLGDEQQVPPVPAVGGSPRPGREQQDRQELREVEDAQQQGGVRLPVDQKCRGFWNHVPLAESALPAK
jgi:hypothetical protein